MGIATSYVPRHGRCLAWFLLLLIATPSPAAGQEPSDMSANAIRAGLRVFTCGHSFHVWVAPLLGEVAKSAGIEGHVMAGLSSIGGSTVLQHWNEQGEANKALRAGTVDVLTLSPIWMPDEGIERFARLAAEHSATVRVTVQEFWLPNDRYEPIYPLDTGKVVDHDATDLAVLAQRQAAYDHDVDEVVRGLNLKLGRTVLLVVPVGRAVIALRERLKAGKAPGLTTQQSLFHDSWGHPGTVVQVLAAYCHFAVIYRRSPIGLPPPAMLAGMPEAGALASLLQALAWDAVNGNPLTGLSGNDGPAPPWFAKPSPIAKVAHAEAEIALGKVGQGSKALARLAGDRDPETAAAAAASVAIVAAWRTRIDADVAERRDRGDLYGAAELAAAIADLYAGDDAAKAYHDLVTELKKDPAYAVGKEFQALPRKPSDPHSAKQIEAFLRKHPDGYYAEQAKGMEVAGKR